MGRGRDTDRVTMTTMFTMIRIHTGGGIRRRFLIGMDTGVLRMRKSVLAHISRALDAHEKQRDQQKMAKRVTHIGES